jgi:2-desacetyl-2-hydroxyethyl bacteriochlorophyllide A dehydrogenase
MTRPRRLVFTDENICALEEFELPPVGDDDVRIRNEASLVSAGTELAVLRRRHRAFSTGGEAAKIFRYPFVPGYAAVGVVEEAGSGVTGLQVGDRVWHPGPHATDAVMPASRVYRVPSGVAPEDAAFFGLAQIAMTAPRRAPIELGDRVLVSGLGLVGMLVGRLYQLSGARVIGADFSPGRRERALRMGFSEVHDLSAAPLTSYFEDEESRADVVIEAAGVEANIDACIKVARYGGRVVLQGSPRNTMEIDPYTDIHKRGLIIIGAHDATVDPARRAQDVPVLFALCREGLQLDELRTHIVPFTSAATLYDRLEDSLDEYLGVVLSSDV